MEKLFCDAIDKISKDSWWQTTDPVEIIIYTTAVDVREPNTE